MIRLPALIALGTVLGLGPLPAWADHGTKSEPPRPAQAASARAAASKAAPAKAVPAKAAARKTKASLADIDLSGAYPEQAPAGLFGEAIEDSLKSVLERIKKAATDDSVAALVLRIHNPELGWGKIQEVRQAINDYRKASKGKKVYAVLEMATNSDYLVASACDEILMPESGWLVTTGINAQVMFFKNLFDKLGIKADMLQMGEFKGAAEPYTRTKMSAALRQNLGGIVNDYYDQLVEAIARRRNSKPEDVKKLIDQAPFTAARAKQFGLIDQVAYADEVAKYLQKRLGVKQVVFKDKYGKKKLDVDFSGLAGFMKFMQTIMGQEPQAPVTNKPKIAVIYATGLIIEGKGDDNGPFGGDMVIASEPMIQALHKAADDPRTVGVVLRVDSPGGSALASDLIWREVIRTNGIKPVVASMSNTAASGGYYISMGCRKIFAEPGTLTGSIGVVGGKLDLGGLLEKIGVTTDTITRGRNAGIFSVTKSFSPSERAAIQRLMQDTYHQFLTKAAQGRKMDLHKLEGLAGGRVWTGRQAKANGLVDQLGTLKDAIAETKTMAGLSKEDEVEIITLPKPKNFLERILGPVDSEAEAAALRAVAPPLARKLGVARILSSLLRKEPTLTVLPFSLDVK